MGTMYYAIMDRCQCCGRGEKYAVCKNMHTFRGYENEWDSPVGAPVISWRDWKDILRRDDTTFESEYGEVVDVEAFIAAVDKIPIEERRKQYDLSLQHDMRYGYSKRNSWLDSGFYTFYGHEFS